jgi:hypothetical protein
VRISYAQFSALGAAVLLFTLLSCGGGKSTSSSTGGNGTTATSASSPGITQDVCQCTPSSSTEEDYRHDAKHVGLPGSTGQEISVADILGWAVGSDPPADAPRSGRELQIVHISHAYAQLVWYVGVDCDIHIEVSNVPDKNAPRVILETPIDSEYCQNRRNLMSGLGVSIAQMQQGYELPQGIPVDVLGMPFRDYNHQRGSPLVATPWELHPAVVTPIH